MERCWLNTPSGKDLSVDIIQLPAPAETALATESFRTQGPGSDPRTMTDQDLFYPKEQQLWGAFQLQSCPGVGWGC